ncbi:fluoride efflux transporter CrcB [Methylohalobius crimeensis]|uniref:fluoride efflux transporter CrcB n=1 Tax=Methylohalobius crimeensis TaxID=244365 RepID=UPI0003B68F1B|nr:fluoride efflux transporter CrcB [Methylohalobius crimeensis]
MLANLLAVAFGGATGALLRFSISGAVYRWLGRGFPHGTLAANLIGSFLLGLLADPLLQLPPSSFPWRAAAATGFLGAFTTFSTFALETVYLIEQGRMLRAFGNLLISIGLGLAAAWTGFLCGRALLVGNGLISLPGVDWPLPWLLGLLANGLVAFIVGLAMEAAFERWRPGPAYRTSWSILSIGGFATVSSLHLLQELLRQENAFHQILPWLVGVFALNLLICAGGVWGGFGTARHL